MRITKIQAEKFMEKMIWTGAFIGLFFLILRNRIWDVSETILNILFYMFLLTCVLGFIGLVYSIENTWGRILFWVGLILCILVIWSAFPNSLLYS